MSTTSVFPTPISRTDTSKLINTLTEIDTNMSNWQNSYRYFVHQSRNGIIQQILSVGSSYKYIKITLKDDTTKRLHLYLMTPDDLEAGYNTLIYETSGNTIYIQEIYKGSKLTMTKSGNVITLYRNATTDAYLFIECIGTAQSAISSVTKSSDNSTYTNANLEFWTN